MSRVYADTLAASMVNLDDPADRGDVQVTLTYNRDDPYTVTVDINHDGQPTVTWQWARDLFRAGLHATSGIGDVIVSPEDGGVLHVELRGEGDGRALMTLDAVEVARWLDRTDRIVQPGDESRHLGDLGRGIRRMLKAER